MRPFALEIALEERNYTTLGDKHAFCIGYFDGYYRMEQRLKSDPGKSYPNAYSAGYWTGFNDAEPLKQHPEPAKSA